MPLRVCLTRSYCTGRVSFSHLNHLQATLEVSGRISDSSPVKFPWEKLSKILWPLWITPQNCACLVWPSMTITELRRKSSVTWKTSWILPMIRQYPGLWGKSCRHHPLLEGTLDPWVPGSLGYMTQEYTRSNRKGLWRIVFPCGLFFCNEPSTFLIALQEEHPPWTWIWDQGDKTLIFEGVPGSMQYAFVLNCLQVNWHSEWVPP